MKTAKLHIRVIEFTCPNCNESLDSSTGSHMFPLEEPLPKTLECFCCKEICKVPARAKKMQGTSHGEVQ